MPVLAQTELQSINSILSAAGEAPVAALGTNDSVQAELILDEVNVEVQSVGWWFNSRTNVTHTPVAGEVTMATNVISIDTQRSDVQLTIRSGKLFNMADGTDDEFTGVIKLDIIELLAYTDLPEVARNYMQKRAAELYLQRITGDTQMADRAARTAEAARGLLMREEIRVRSIRYFGRRDRIATDWRNPLNQIHGG